MRLHVFIPLLLLCLTLGACSRDRLEIEYIPVKTEEGDRVTLMAPDGKTVDYDFKGDVSPVFDGVFTVRDRRGYTVYRFDRKNPKVVENLEDLDWVGLMSEGLIPFRRKDGGRLEFADADGEVRFSLGKDVRCSGFFVDGLMIVFSTDKETYASLFGAVNTKGELVVKMKYDDIRSFNEGCAPAKLGDKWILIDKKGEKISELNGVDLVGGPMVDGYMPVRRGEHWGLWSRKGEFTRFKNNLTINCFNGRYAIVEDEDGGYGVYDVEAQQVVPTRYEGVSFSGRDRFLCNKGNDRWLILDSDGEKVADIRAEQLLNLDSNIQFIGGDFLIGGEPGCYYLYDRDGNKIPDSRFRQLGRF